MANRVRLRFSGLDELRHAVRAYGQQLVADATEAVTSAVEQTVDEARSAAPVFTGRLRDSIVGQVSTDGYRRRGVVRARAPHAHLLEFGTARIAKRPHLVPAAVRNRRSLNAAMRASVLRRAPEGLGTPRLSGDGPATPGIAIE